MDFLSRLLRGRRSQVKQRTLPFQARPLLLAKHADYAVLPIVAGVDFDFAAAHPAHALGHQRPGAAFNRFESGATQDFELRAYLGQEPIVHGADFFALRANANRSADHFVEWDQVLVGRGDVRAEPLRAVGQLLHPV